MTIYLYIKTHTKTGLKYLGKTTKDPYTYLGSGVNWKKHLKENGKEHTTEIIAECESNIELNKLGRYYSELHNVVESEDWANIIPETGGGSCGPEAAHKISIKLKGKKKPPRTNEHKINASNCQKGIAKPRTSEGLKRYFDSNPDRTEMLERVAKSLKIWYENNPEKSSKKAQKTWDTRYANQYEKYKEAINLIKLGKGYKTIKKLCGICLRKKSIKSLRDKSHRIYELFPEFKEIWNIHKDE